MTLVYPKYQIRSAHLNDLDALVQLENRCFEYDRISRRSFRHHIASEHSEILLAEVDSVCLAYGLVLNHKGTRLSRLYSIAVSQEARGTGLARQLLLLLEAHAAARERHYMRLEVAKQNQAAIRLYESCGYRTFGEYADYYEDHTDALRMQKRIRQLREHGIHRVTPWCEQTTEFTCGPASLMMAMMSLDQTLDCNVDTELDIWREATTIFMTSGHGGCHPFGLALAAEKRGFDAAVWVNTDQPLFVDGVRTVLKKQVMTRVHQQFLTQCEQHDVVIHYQAMTLDDVRQNLAAGSAVLMLVSTYRLDGKKAPHWVVVTGIDNDCLFVHDPYPSEPAQTALDCQHVPIAREDFDKMTVFGAQRIQAAVTISVNNR